MKNSFINLSFDDNIFAQIQKEQILKIIAAQHMKKKTIQNSEMHLRFRNQGDNAKRWGAAKPMNRSFSIKTKRGRQQGSKVNLSRPNMGLDIGDQKAYFSVRHSYEKMIHNLKDQQVIDELRFELTTSPKNMTVVGAKHQSCNYFQKILGGRVKPSRITRYAVMQSMKNPEQTELIRTSMNFYKYL